MLTEKESVTPFIYTGVQGVSGGIVRLPPRGWDVVAAQNGFASEAVPYKSKWDAIAMFKAERRRAEAREEAPDAPAPVSPTRSRDAASWCEQWDDSPGREIALEILCD